jgi:hypothetical protein
MCDAEVNEITGQTYWYSEVGRFFSVDIYQRYATAYLRGRYESERQIHVATEMMRPYESIIPN